MTDKEFVLSIYPKCISCFHSSNFYTIINFSSSPSEWIFDFYGFISEDDAWRECSNWIKRKIERKLMG